MTFLKKIFLTKNRFHNPDSCYILQRRNIGLKILFSGIQNVGKTTIIEKIVQALSFTPSGFRTIVVGDCEQNDQIAIVPYDAPADAFDPASVVATRYKDTRKTQVRPEVFDTVGASILREARESEDAKLIIMDELGFMENDAPLFQEEVLRCLDSDIPVLGVVKPERVQTPFLCKVRGHESVRVIPVTEENREAVFQEIAVLYGTDKIQKIG
jgi:nucleoside-triphosphatase